MHKLKWINVALFSVFVLNACARPDQWYVSEAKKSEVTVERDEREETDKAETPGHSHAVDHDGQLDSGGQLSVESKPLLKKHEDGSFLLSVEEAVLHAIAYNRDLHMQRLDADIARTFEQIERSRYDPELFLNISTGEERSSETDRGTGNQFEVNSDNSEVVLGLRQELPTGTDIEVNISLEQDNSDRTPDQSETRFGISVTQALLRGLGPLVNTARIQQAAIDAEISIFELRAFAESLVYETESTYWRFVAARERIAAVESALVLAEQQRSEMKERIQLGVAAQNQMAASEAELALRKQSLIEAKSNYQELQLRLLSLMQLPLVNLFDQRLSPTTAAEVTPATGEELKQHIALALLKRPELGEAYLRLKQRRLETVVTQNGLMPRLDFFVALGKTGFGADVSDAFSGMDDDTYDARIGFNFSYRLGDRSAAARHHAAYVGEEKAAEAISNLKQLVEFELRLAWNAHERASQQIEASRATVLLQEESLRSEQERLRAGAGASLMVAQAQRDLLQARFVFIQAISAYRIASINLYRAEGTLLQRRGLLIGQLSDEE